MTDDSLAARPAELRTPDGAEIAGDVVAPARPWAGAVVCHPHPDYGGDRHNPVVDRIFRALGAAGVVTVRFDFRRGDDGGTHAGHGDEQLDVAAAIDLVTEHTGPDLPLWLVGYSFGADVVLGVDSPAAAGWVAVAPPLRFGPPPRPGEGDQRPVLVVVPDHDQVAPAARVREVAAGWPRSTVTAVPMADHFLAGAAGTVAAAVVTWIRDRSPGAR